MKVTPEYLRTRLWELAHSPSYAPSSVFANACGEAEAVLRKAELAFATLTRAIEKEGYDVLVDVDGTFSVRRREEPVAAEQEKRPGRRVIRVAEEHHIIIDHVPHTRLVRVEHEYTDVRTGGLWSKNVADPPMEPHVAKFVGEALIAAAAELE